MSLHPIEGYHVHTRTALQGLRQHIDTMRNMCRVQCFVFGCRLPAISRRNLSRLWRWWKTSMQAMYASPPVGALTATAGSLPSASTLAAVIMIGGVLLPIDSQAATAESPVARQMEGGEVSQNVPFMVLVCFGMISRSKTGAGRVSVEGGLRKSRRDLTHSRKMLPANDLGLSPVCLWLTMIALS